MNNTENIKVSVIVPVYNVEKFLSKCIESIQNQTHKNLEIIFVNDGSSDSSSTILRHYEKKDTRIIVIDKENTGVSDTRNWGINYSTGEFVCFADADDYLMEDYVQYLLDLAISHKAEIALTTNLFSNFDLKQIKSDNIRLLNSEQATEEMLCYRYPIGVYSKIFSRKFLGENIRFLEELFIGEGFNFNVTSLQKANKVVVGEKKIYFYRKDNSESATTKFSIEKWENGLYAIQVIKKNLIIRSSNILDACDFANWRTHTDVYDLLILSSTEKEYPELYLQCLKIMKQYFLVPFKVPTTPRQRLRALILRVSPRTIPFLMRLRRLKYNVKIDN